MCTFMRLTQTFKASEEVLFDDKSKIVFFSDCHRGDLSNADNFLPNRRIYLSALDFYYNTGYTYIEIGDGDELWENDGLSPLLQSHRDVYKLIQKFHRDHRFYMLWGNHDIFKSFRGFAERNLYKYYNPETDTFELLFENIKIHEGLVLRYQGTPYKIFVVHGHQGDVFNDALWPVSRFLVRYVWRHFENFARNNPTSPARNLSRMNVVENNLVRWVSVNNQMVIAGHTHNPSFARPGQIPYFNDGCCVKKGYITCIEIENGNIMLVRWYIETSENKKSSVTREIIAGPERIIDFFK